MENHSYINNQFIPYEQALKLKELGFDEECFAWIDTPKLELVFTNTKNSHERFITLSYKDCCAAPLWSQAFDWFRVKHRLDSYVSQQTKSIAIYEINQISLSDKEVPYSYVDFGFDTYEEARLECLKKLIEVSYRI